MLSRKTTRRRIPRWRRSEVRPFAGLLVGWTVSLLVLVGVLSLLHQVSPA